MKNTIKTIGLTTIAILALTACGGGSNDTASNYTPYPFDAPPISESLKNEYLTAINNVRSVGRTCGELGFFPAVAPLTWNDALYKASYEHSEDMATVNVPSHSGSKTESDWTYNVRDDINREFGSGYDDRAYNNGLDLSKKKTTETVAYGFSSLSGAINGWLNSPRHCTALMSNEYKLFGMARVSNYWTQMFSE